ncbi:MAG: ABC transporter ATP-binding protein [SAR324 cluster bacterium]|nr:ABC transporter ATP-binding protein [SAR324 cluster bacterium]
MLYIKNLQTSFKIKDQWQPVVQDVSFHVNKGESLGIIGESGCGKTVTSLSLMRLIPGPRGKITSGQILYEGTDLLSLTPEEFRPYRGTKLAMVFQDPMTSLNPVLPIGLQLTEAMVHRGMTQTEANLKALALLDKVGISDGKSRLKAYPHQLSGGMKQRIMIAMALGGDPEILIADEPTTALDVTIQAQILGLLDDLRRERGMGLILITHDLGVVAQVCDRVLVMYGGCIVEEAKILDLFQNPQHPYTTGLMSSIQSLTDNNTNRLSTIDGLVPTIGNFPKGCPFHNRCPKATDYCLENMPPLTELSSKKLDQGPFNSQHKVACFFPEGTK